jgi:hypothetical protein
MTRLSHFFDFIAPTIMGEEYRTLLYIQKQ